MSVLEFYVFNISPQVWIWWHIRLCQFSLL